MRLNEFKRLHPWTSFIYFAAVIGFSMFFMNPLCLCISLCGGFICAAVLTGGRSVRRNAAVCLSVIFFTAIINPLFSHRGMTVLAYFPDGNPLTAESVAYGAAAGTMIASVICWFSCFNEVMTSDKLMCVFGRIIPSLSLIFSMTLRFVPNFSYQMKKTAYAQKNFRENDGKGFVGKVKNALSVLSSMLTWALENSVETADSMRNRGYGTGIRTSFSNYRISPHDTALMGITVSLAVFIIVFSGELHFKYFPEIKAAGQSYMQTAVLSAYAVLCILPLIIELWEECRWRVLKSKI